VLCIISVQGLAPHESNSLEAHVDELHLDGQSPAPLPASAVKLLAKLGLQGEQPGGRSRTKPATGTPAPASSSGKCGVDVTAPLQKVIQDMVAYWPTLPKAQRDETCSYLGPISNLLSGRNPKTAGVAWDIVQMYSKNYPTSFASQNRAGCATGTCALTVGVNGQCSYTGSVNYVIFGHMCRLCGKWEVSMKTLIWGYKGTKLPYFLPGSANYQQSMDWSIAGFAGWGLPGSKASTPKGDRLQCPVTCGAWKGKPFTVHWHPYELMVSDKKYIKW